MWVVMEAKYTESYTENKVDLLSSKKSQIKKIAYLLSEDDRLLRIVCISVNGYLAGKNRKNKETI